VVDERSRTGRGHHSAWTCAGIAVAAIALLVALAAISVEVGAGAAAVLVLWAGSLALARRPESDRDERLRRAFPDALGDRPRFTRDRERDDARR
jgi:hypothetical protein